MILKDEENPGKIGWMTSCNGRIEGDDNGAGDQDDKLNWVEKTCPWCGLPS